MKEDMIDFPVSDTWRDYYYEKGLTPYPSPRYFNRRTDEMKSLNRQIYQQNTTISQQSQQIESLQHKIDRMEKKMFGSKKAERKEGGNWELK